MAQLGLMKKSALLLLLSVGLILCSACQSPFGSVNYGGGDGASPQAAVVIQGARDESAGIRAEYEWIARNYPGARKKTQRLGNFRGRPQDIIVITTAAGEEKTLYFDIGGFFGKMGY